MTTEVLGYIAAPTTTQTIQKPTTKPIAKRRIWDIAIPTHILQKLLAVILIELGAISIPIAEGDCTAFLMILFIAVSMIFAEKEEN